MLATPLALSLIPYGLIAGMRLVPDRNPLTRVPHSGDKTIAMIPPLSLSLHQARAKVLGVTFNDYIIAAVLRGTSAYIAQQHGTQHHTFTVGIPNSLRGQPTDDSPLPPGNDITYLMVPMPAVTSAALAKEVSRVTKQATAFPVLIQSSNLTLRALTLLPKAVGRKFIQMLGDNVTMALSNVQGPKAPLSYDGVHIKHLFATPVAGMPITAAVVSYAEHFTLTLTSDLAVIKDISLLSRMVTAELAKTQQESS